MAATRRRHIDISSHLTHDELALLVEGRAGDAAEGFRNHLSHCKSCYEAYQEAVEFRARALAGKEPHAPPELIQNGRNVPLRRGKKKGVTRRPRGRVIIASLGGLAVLATVWVLFGPGVAEKSLTSVDVAVVQKYLAANSGQGLVFPELSGAEAGPTYRGAPASAEVERVVGELKKAYQEKRASAADDLFWLAAAELASGRLDSARPYLREALAAHPEDARFLKLDAILAYRDNRLTDAEADLRKVLQKDANDSEAEYNLGLVLIEKGNTAEGLSHLQRVSEDKESPLHERARAVIDSLALRSR